LIKCFVAQFLIKELLLAILDSLHEDSNKVRKKPAVPPMEDEWVNNTPVPRVGREAWWRYVQECFCFCFGIQINIFLFYFRYLRRNKSVITNTAMGQVMSRVTCPICDHSSLNFDPFGILSIPFPTANDVVFHFTLIRRASYTNCPFTLAKRKGSGESRETKNISNSPPSNHSIFEKYALSMSRLADIADLKLSLQNLTGIPVNKLKLYSRSEITPNAKNSSNSAEKSTALNSYFKVIPLPDKPGPCFQLAAKLKASSNSPDTPTEILAFESTLNPRPQLDTEVSTTSDEDSDESGRSVPPKTRDSSAEKQRLLEKQSKSYGDEKECFEFDSDPVALAKAMSRRLWPRNASDFSIGLRVDAIDQRKRWFSGSLVEIIESDSIDKKENGDSMRSTSEVKIHFDNFSPKWDEHYNIRHFRDKVRPLYSNAVPKINPIEFMVYHRRTNVPIEEKINEINLFGHPFMIECHSEWSTARTGAHIIAQASRFLQNKMKVHKSLLNALGRIDTDEGNELSKEDVYDRIVYEASVVVNDIIRVLIESDRRHVLTSAGIISERESRSKDSEKKRKRRSSTPGSSLRKKLASLLPKLPFEIRVCEFDVGSAQKGTRKITDEVLFPFSLVRTIGNFMTSQSSIILDWKDVSELFSRIIGYRKMSQSGSYPSFSYQEYPILYTQPKIEIHKESRSLLNENGLNEKKTANGNNDSGQSKKRGTTPDGGMKLDACLDEFCKELHAEGWTCPKCKKTREGRQKMTLWHLPDLLTFHIKRFNCNARWREKISTKVNFPLTGLNMKNWCDAKSPLAEAEDESTIYDLVGVINHYGGMTGGHYVAACKATQCSSDGVESVAHTFSGVGINTYVSIHFSRYVILISSISSSLTICYVNRFVYFIVYLQEMEGETVQTGWRLGRNKDKDNTAVQSKIAMEQARGVADSCEPLWLQFDDDLVEPIPPRNVVSETAYVLFYRRRRLSPANIAKYTALD